VFERWTRTVLRFRAVVLVCWLVALVGGSVGAAELPRLLSNSYAVPGTESERARTLLERRFGEQPEGTFVAVFEVTGSSKGLKAKLQRRLERAAALVPTGRAGELLSGDGILYGDIATNLGLTEAKGYTERLRESLRAEGEKRVYVGGQPALQHDLDPIVRQDLRRAELVAIPIALAILVAVFGLSLAVLVPLVFAAFTIAVTLGIVYLLAHGITTTTYVTEFVELIGLGLAIDYSLLIIHRFKQELPGDGSTNDAVVRTMATAGRTVVASGLAVAVWLAVLLVVPVPFMRSLGIAGLLIPLVSIAAVVTLQPALLSILGERGTRGLRAGRQQPVTEPEDAQDFESSFWTRLAHAIVRHPRTLLVLGVLVLGAASIPFLSLSLTPGSIAALPSASEAIRGFNRLSDGVGPGAVTPTQIVVDATLSRGTRTGPVREAIDRLADELFRDPEVQLVASGRRDPYVDESGHFARLVVVGRHEYGAEPSRQLIRRLREDLVPAAAFPAAVVVSAGGFPPQGVDFLDRSYTQLPWIILALLSLTYVILLRTFRSLLLPLTGVLLNLLTVSAVCGLLVLVFQWGVGRSPLGIPETSEIEAWVPLVLFATLFGLSMDYEVFLVSRMREAWDEVPDNDRAIARGLALSGRVVTAAAAIMVVVFAGFVAGRVVGLQQLGFGLALGIFIDATIVRMLVLPSLMAVCGRYNWWLPASVARIARVEPSPLRQ
jgi:RND superfamily putative drug exporter